MSKCETPADAEKVLQADRRASSRVSFFAALGVCEFAGDEIPPGAQIIGICDVYQALISPRAQRPALGEERARRLIEQEIGRLWNPAVAHAFLEMLAKRGPASSASEQSAHGGPNLRVAEG